MISWCVICMLRQKRIVQATPTKELPRTQKILRRNRSPDSHFWWLCANWTLLTMVVSVRTKESYNYSICKLSDYRRPQCARALILRMGEKWHPIGGCDITTRNVGINQGFASESKVVNMHGDPKTVTSRYRLICQGLNTGLYHEFRKRE